jgi:hypothetical protein
MPRNNDNGKDSSSINWADIIYRGVETQELDYKAAQNWLKLSRVGKAKFARHAMAMANTHGGYVVVGVGEDANGNPTDYTGLTDAQLRSFDPSIVGQFINLYADPSIDFDIARPEVDGKHYAVFVIRRFSGLPHVSSDHCGDELQQGAFYIRTPDARSRPAYRASELHGLVQRALRNQRIVLGRMLRGVLYEGKQLAEPDAEREFPRLIQESALRCRKWLGPRNLAHFCNLEIAAYPTEFQEDALVLTEVKKAVGAVAVPLLSDFPLLNRAEAESFFTNQSLLSRARSEPLDRFHFWQAFQSGLFHHISSLAPLTNDQREIDYPALVQRIGAALKILGDLYSELGYEDELLTFTIGLSNVEGTVLVHTPTACSEPEGYRCYIPDVIVRKRRTVADLATGPVEHVQRVVQEVCERFNFSAERHKGLGPRLKKLLG